jgi:peptidoglycan hydrolase-like protein with peptidoglycan-binding domain
MPIIGVILNPGKTGAEVHELHEQLLAVGAVIAPGEQNEKKYGPSTVAAVRAFRQWYDLPAGDTVDLPTGRLMHVAAAFAGTGGRVALRAAVREAASAADNSQPQELYRLARYATLVDYQMAYDIARRIPDHPGVRAVIEPILAPPEQPAPPAPGQPPAAPQPRPPEVPYPENFYAYRRPWVDPERVALDWPNLKPEEHNPLQAAGGPPAIAALRYWHEGNDLFNRRRYAAAIAAYDACQDSVLTYFNTFYRIDPQLPPGNIELPAGNRTDRLVALIKRLYELRDKRLAFWDFFQRRRELLALAELEEHDRIVPDAYDSALNFVWRQMGNPSVSDDPPKDFRERNLDAPLVTLAFVLVPLARAEANRARRQYDDAIRDLQWVLRSVVVGVIFGPPIRRILARLACEFIELPFAKLLLAETLLDKADAEHKARITAEPPPAPDVAAYQGLKAAQTYLAIKDQFSNEGEYVAWVDTSREELAKQIQQRLATNDTRSPAFQLLGKDILIGPIGPAGALVRTITSSSSTLPGLDRRAKAHEPLLKFIPPAGQTVMRETNPRVYAALLTATAHLEQLKASFNYLGYLDSYVPPWRFQFLLERARYFAEHAKNAQREYLNFLSNAEREEFQELSTSQNVEMEKSNVRIETARVDQVMAEVAASQTSKELSRITAANAEERLKDYKNMDEKIDDLEQESSFWSFVGGAGAFVAGLAAAPATGGLSAAAAFGGLASLTGQTFSRQAEQAIANEQREFEKKNLQRAEEEARQAVQVAEAQLAVAQAGLVVAGLQRQAALLRHEFALQNLQFLRNRVLSAEQWYPPGGRDSECQRDVLAVQRRTRVPRRAGL